MCKLSYGREKHLNSTSIAPQFIGMTTHWMLYGVFIVQIGKYFIIIGTCFILTSISRFLLCGVPKRSGPSQENCATFTYSWNNPNDHIYTRYISGICSWFWQSFSGQWSQHRMDLCAVDDGLRYLEMTPQSLFLYFTEHYVVAFLTQVFYSYRIAVFTRSKYAAAVTVMVGDKLLFAVFFLFDHLIYFSSSFLLCN